MNTSTLNNARAFFRFSFSSQAFLVVLLALVGCFKNSIMVKADLSTHKYGMNERVELFVNKVGPYANPQETYGYYR